MIFTKARSCMFEEVFSFLSIKEKCELFQLGNRDISGEDPFIRESQKGNPKFFDAFMLSRKERDVARSEIYHRFLNNEIGALPEMNEISAEELFEMDPSLQHNIEFIKSALRNNSHDILFQINFPEMENDQYIDLLCSFINETCDESVLLASNKMIANITDSINGQDVDFSSEGDLVLSSKFLLSINSLINRFRGENPSDEFLSFFKQNREKILGKLQEGKKEHFEKYMDRFQKINELEQIRNALLENEAGMLEDEKEMLDV